jgi:hypothetical protein
MSPPRITIRSPQRTDEITMRSPLNIDEITMLYRRQTLDSTEFPLK